MASSPPTRRVIDTLEHLAHHSHDEGRTIAQVADAIGVARPTMSAILAELDAAGWVERDTERAYRLGSGVGGLARAAEGPASAMTPEIVELLGSLVAATSCGVTVSRFVGQRMTVAAKVHSPTRPVPGLGVGQTLTVSYPAGAAVMAWRPEADQQAWRDGRPDAEQLPAVVHGVRERGYAAYRPASSDASLVESLADLLGAVGPMLIDPAIRRSAIRQLAELSSRAYVSDELDVDEPIPVSYVSAPVFHRGLPDYELQLGVLRSSVTRTERDAVCGALVETAGRISALLDAD